MKSNLGILPSLEGLGRLGKLERAKAFADRAQNDLENFLMTDRTEELTQDP